LVEIPSTNNSKSKEPNPSQPVVCAVSQDAPKQPKPVGFVGRTVAVLAANTQAAPNAHKKGGSALVMAVEFGVVSKIAPKARKSEGSVLPTAAGGDVSMPDVKNQHKKEISVLRMVALGDAKWLAVKSWTPVADCAFVTVEEGDFRKKIATNLTKGVGTACRMGEIARKSKLKRMERKIN